MNDTNLKSEYSELANESNQAHAMNVVSQNL